MKFAIQYVCDNKGKINSVQLSFKDWEKLLRKLNKNEQALKMKSGLSEAFEQFKQLTKKGKNN
jgi:hypothetical protein